jgi:DNA-directed RNA polymerase sigma subunit (sigma70/sigma32)
MMLTTTEHHIYGQEAYHLVDHIMCELELSQRDSDMALDRWQYDMTYKALAEDYGVSKERARQIVAKVERKVLKRIRTMV